MLEEKNSQQELRPAFSMTMFPPTWISCGDCCCGTFVSLLISLRYPLDFTSHIPKGSLVYIYRYPFVFCSLYRLDFSFVEIVSAWFSFIDFVPIFRLQAGSSLSPQIYQASHSTPLFGHPEIWHTCSMNPCQPPTDFFIFFPPDMFTCTFWDIWVLRDPKFPVKKKKGWKKKKIHQRLGRDSIEHVCKQAEVFSPKRRGLWTFVRKTCVICVVAL